MRSELARLVDDGSPIAAIADYLDRCAPARREHEATSLDRRRQARLFEKAADAPPLTLADFVPAEVPALIEVAHAGRNTIATLRVFQRFEKRFARAADGRVFGYNASPAFFIRPGYFVAYETGEASKEWQRRGGVVIDYHRVPEPPLPSGWPKVVANGRGLQRFVYHRTRDFMRRVSTHVTIGRASREDPGARDRVLDYWFALCRRTSNGRSHDPRR